MANFELSAYHRNPDTEFQRPVVLKDSGLIAETCVKVQHKALKHLALITASPAEPEQVTTWAA